jgi:hypothetical protein
MPLFRASGGQDQAERQNAARQELPIVEHTWPVQKVRAWGNRRPAVYHPGWWRPPWRTQRCFAIRMTITRARDARRSSASTAPAHPAG